MGKSHVKVYVRTRPTAQLYNGVRVISESNTFNINLPKNESAGIINNQLDNLTFKLDGILENCSQETVYSTCAHDVVDATLQGYNGTIFCYGQTGAGKTFTMAGDLRNYHHRGVIPRALHHIFRDIDMRPDRIYKVQVSYMEIYNEMLSDLLSEDPGSSEELAILDDTSSNTCVRGLTRIDVSGEEEALAQFFLGEQRRSTASHVLNSSSSRSHAVFTIYVEMRTSAEASERALLSKLHLVDLAGSERTKKTGVTGQALLEANFINRSLSFLEQTVNALARKDAHVPFRQTKLTSVLRDALGGNCRTVMVANVWPEGAHIEETVSTLRFASRVRTLTTDLQLTESSDPALLARKYERQIKELKQELAMRDTLSGRGRVGYDDLTEAEQRELAALAKRYLAGEAEVEELPVDSLKRTREAFKALKLAHQSLTTEMGAELTKYRASVEGGMYMGEQKSVSDPNAVGEADLGAGIHIGLAPADARPPPTLQSRGDVGLHETTEAFPTKSGTANAADPGDSLVLGSDGDRNALFMRFKHEAASGRELSSQLKDRTAQVKQLRQSIKDVGTSVNYAKNSIDTLTERVASLRAAQPVGSEDIADSEVYKLLQDLKSVKLQYRTEFDRLRELRSSVELVESGAAETRQKLLAAFNTWCSSSAATQGMVLDGDELDPGEAFDRMEMERIMAVDPDSTAYHAAHKKAVLAAAKTSSGRPRAGAA